MSGKKKKYYTIKISRTELCFWIVGGIFALFWMFVLGVLVGQEVIYLPEVPQVHLFKKSPLKMLSPKSKARNTPASKFVTKPKPAPKSRSVTSPLTSLEKKTSSGKKLAVVKTKERQYAIQIGAFTKKDNATSLQNKLKKQGYKVFIRSTKVNARTYYRVYVGPYPLKEALNYYADLSPYHPAKPTPLP